MNKIRKKSLNATLALLLAVNLGGCSLFERNDEDDLKETENKSNTEQKNNETKNDKTTDEDLKINDVVEDENFTNHMSGGNEYKSNHSSNGYSSNDNVEPSQPLEPEEVVKTNFAVLRALLIECKKIDTSIYTSKSISVFKNAVGQAEVVLNANDSIQLIVDLEVQQLKNAKSQLTLLADFSKLIEAMDKVDLIDTEKYTPISISDLKNIIILGQAVLNDRNSSQEKVNEMIKSIESSVATLIKRADFDILIESVKQAKLIKDEEYTDASLLKMYNSLKNAESVINNLNASQKVVDEANKDLQGKLNDLVKYIAPDMSILINLLVQAREYKENEYSITSYSFLKQAISQGEDTLDISKVTKTQVLKAVDDLQKAIDNLGVDVTSLQIALKNVQEIDEMLYTPSSYQKVKNAIDSTNLLLSSTYKQFEIDAQEKVLKDSVKQLIKRANKTDLQKAINDAKATYGGDYTAETMNTLKSVVSEAELVFNNLEATEEEVSNTIKKVTDALSQLKFVVHKEKLQVMINKVKLVKEEDYTPNSYSVLKLAYDRAMIVNDNEDATQKQVDACTSTLETSFNNLLKRANITLLNQKIADANVINLDNYTDESLIVFNIELIKAKELVKNLNVTQENIDTQLISLTNAMNKLIAYVAPNLDAINQAINEANNTKAEDWSTVSYKIMITKLNDAKEIVNKKKVTQAEIDEAKNALLTAYKALSVDLSILNNTLMNAKSYQEINYTLDSYKGLQDAITHVEDFLKATHTQSEVNTELISLQIAVDQLILFEEEDKTVLIIMILEAKKINESDYTPNSYLLFSTSITNAEVVRNNYRATASEISIAINELDSTKANLVKRAVTTTLNEVIIEAKSKYTGQFTTSSLNALKVAVVDGETTLNNVNALKNEVDTKTQNIKTAITNLVKLGDKTVLSKLINELDSLQESDYTPVSWASASLGNVLTEAIVIRDKTEATNDEVNFAIDSLTQAKEKLVKKADVTELSNEITKAQSELLKGYTTVSKDTLNDAIVKAQDIVANLNATAFEVSTVLSNLKNAIVGLKVDVTPLSNEINATKAVDTSNKLSSTIIAMQNAINEAEIYRDSSNVTFDGMDEHIQKLKDAVMGLIDKTDTTTLVTKLNEAKALSKDDYTSESYGKLLVIINEVEQALLNENITSDQIAQLVIKLDVAIKELKKVETVAAKRKECEQLIVNGHELLNNFMIQAPEQYTKELEDQLLFVEGELSKYTDDQFTIAEIEKYMDNIIVAMNIYKDNAYDMEAMVKKYQAKIAEVRAMDMTGYTENSVNSVNYYANHLEESIVEKQNYAYLESAYGWLMDAINDLTADTDTTVYVNEKAPGEVLALLNAERKKLGLVELTMDTKLCEATTIRATEAKDQTGLFSEWAHKRPDGRQWNTVLDEINYHQSYAGENAASGYTSGVSLYNGWLSSTGHKENMLKPNFTKVGISMIKVGNGQWISYMILAE